MYPPRRVCAKFGVIRVNGRGDIAGREVSKNVFDKGRPGGGARGVHVRHQDRRLKFSSEGVCVQNLP